MSLIWMSHVTHMNESWHTYEWVMSHIWTSHVTNSACGLNHSIVVVTPLHSHHTYERVMSHIWTFHVTHMNESCHTYEWVMSHTAHAVWTIQSLSSPHPPPQPHLKSLHGVVAPTANWVTVAVEFRCAYVCVCERERGCVWELVSLCVGQRERERERLWMGVWVCVKCVCVGESVCVCTCACIYVWVCVLTGSGHIQVLEVLVSFHLHGSVLWVSLEVSFFWWVLQHCTGFARLVWGRLRVHRAFVYMGLFCESL